MATSSPVPATPAAESPDDLLDLSVAAAGRCHPGSLRRRITRDGFPAVKVGGRYKVRRGDLDLIATPVGDADPALEAAVARVLANAPALSEEQRECLGRLIAAG